MIHRGICTCGRAAARVDSGLCEMCTEIPLHKQWGFDRWLARQNGQDVLTADVESVSPSCGICGTQLLLPDSIERGYCLECHLVAQLPDPTADADVTDEQAIANALQIFTGAQVITDAPADDDTVRPDSRFIVQSASAEQNAAYRAGLCIDCRSRSYSPGRPRCSECHCIWLKNGTRSSFKHHRTPTR